MNVNTILKISAIVLGSIFIIGQVKKHNRNRKNILLNQKEIEDPKPKDDVVRDEITGKK
jgi:hypothetical protein